MADAPKILGTDTLRDAYPKLNSAIDNSNEAKTKADGADGKADTAIETANTAKTTADTVQSQFDQVVAEAGENNPEVVQARGEAVNLNARLNATDAQLADLAINVKNYGAKGDWNGTTGTDDITAITNSVNSLVSGQTLFFPDGKYAISSKITINKEITVTMSEHAEIVFIGNPTVSTEGTVTISSPNVVLNNVSIDVNSKEIRGLLAINTSNPPHNLTINNLTVKNSKMVGVWIDGVNRLKVNGIIAENCNSALDGEFGSIRIENCEKFKVNNVEIETTSGKGMAFKNSHKGNISQVIIDGTANRQVGLYLNSCEKVESSLIHIYNADESAVKFSRGTKDCHVTNSVFESKDTSGTLGGYTVILQGTSNCSVSRSTIISRGSSQAVRIEDHPDPEGAESVSNKIYKNKIEVFYNTQVPVYINKRADTTYTSKNHVIEDNVIIGGVEGVYIQNVNGVKILKNRFINQVGTVIKQTGTDNLDLTIEGNEIENALDVGVSTYKIANSKIKNNTIRAASSIATGKNGINLGTNSVDVDISNNTVVGFTNYAISGIATGITRINVSNNSLDGSSKGSYGIYLNSNVSFAVVACNAFTGYSNKYFVSSSIVNQYVVGNL
jgi:hypothetical protein